MQKATSTSLRSCDLPLSCATRNTAWSLTQPSKPMCSAYQPRAIQASSNKPHTHRSHSFRALHIPSNLPRHCRSRTPRQRVSKLTPAIENAASRCPHARRADDQENPPTSPHAGPVWYYQSDDGMGSLAWSGLGVIVPNVNVERGDSLRIQLGACSTSSLAICRGVVCWSPWERRSGDVRDGVCEDCAWKRTYGGIIGRVGGCDLGSCGREL